MKTFCRIICCLLIAVMALSFVACTGGEKTKAPVNSNKPSDNTSTSGEEGPTPPAINETFGGTTIKFFINGGEDGTSLQCRSIVVSENDDPTYEVNVQTTERNRIVEETLDVKIELAGTCNMQAANEVLKPILQSHVYTYDVVGLYQYFDLGLALGDTVGSFYNYCNMPEGVTNYINLDASYWSKSLFDTLTLNNTGFFLTGDLCQNYAGTMFVSFVNSRLWNEFSNKIAELPNNPKGYKSIYDIVKNGYWTLDLWMDLSQMAYQDLNRNDERDYQDQAGLMTYDQQPNNIMADMLAAGSNVHYSRLDESGRPVMAVNTPANVAFAGKLYQLLVESSAVTIPWISGENEDDKTYIMDFFAQGNTLLTVNTLVCAEHYLADMKDDFYVMPLPMFDTKQFDADSESLGYTTQIGDSVSQYAICKDIGEERIPAVTATMELMAFYSEQMVTPAFYDKALKDRYTRNPEDAAIIDMTKAGVYTDFSTAWSNHLDDITWYFRQNYASRNYAQDLKKKSGKCSVSMTTLLEKLEEAYFVE